MKNKILITVLLACMCGIVTTTFAQTKEKKVVIVKKTVDDKGNEKSEVIQKSGDEVDDILKELETNGDLEGVKIKVVEDADGMIEIEVEGEKENAQIMSITEDVEVSEKVVDGKKVKQYAIRINKNGEEKVMEWQGDGPLPENIIKMMDGEGRKMVMIDIDEEDFDFDQKLFMTKDVMRPENKVKLGIMLEDEGKGVHITEVFVDSPAHKSKLAKGDVILKVGNEYIFNSDGLIDALSVYDEGDEVEIKYLRDEKEKKTKVKF